MGVHHNSQWGERVKLGPAYVSGMGRRGPMEPHLRVRVCTSVRVCSFVCELSEYVIFVSLTGTGQKARTERGLPKLLLLQCSAAQVIDEAHAAITTRWWWLSVKAHTNDHTLFSNSSSPVPGFGLASPTYMHTAVLSAPPVSARPSLARWPAVFPP